MANKDGDEEFEESLKKALKLSQNEKRIALRKIVRFQIENKGNEERAMQAAKHLSDDGTDGGARLEIEKIFWPK